MKLIPILGLMLGLVCAEFALIELLCGRKLWLPLGAVGAALVTVCAMWLRP